MAADAFGNDVAVVGLPVTGFIGLAPLGTPLPSPSAGKSPTLTLDTAFKKLGLFTQDGGFEWTMEPDGDWIEFFQEGYSIPTGLATVEVVAKLAQYNEVIRSFLYNRTADANGYITIDGGGNALHYALFTEEIFKNGVIRRRAAANVVIKMAKLDKTERGALNGLETTFKVFRDPAFGGDHIGEWLIPAPSSAPATITAVTPATAVAGSLVTITGTNFLGATDLKFGAVSSLGIFVDSPTQIRAIMPPGSAGAANVTVTTAAGASSAFTYTRGA